MFPLFFICKHDVFQKLSNHYCGDKIFLFLIMEIKDMLMVSCIDFTRKIVKIN